MKNNLSKLMSTKAASVADAPKVSYSFLPEAPQFPLVIKPEMSGLILNQWVRDHQQEVNEKVAKYGAILFRGFQINTVEKFQEFISTFEASPLEYKQRSSPRYEVAKNIYHSTTYPADQIINMHSENSYALNWAMRIVFCCIQAAEEQGETPIADNRNVVKYLTAATREKFLTKGVKYIRNVVKGIGLSWQEVFQTEDPAVVEEECRKNGMEFTWKDADRLVMTWNNKAIYDHPDTGEEIWFNHAFFFNKYALQEELLSTFESDDDLPFHTCYGDGSAITKEEIEEIRAAYEKATVAFLWEKGDVLFMDNMLIAHGRNRYKGDRQIIVSMF
jgi:alpha-ketoglutarate-dependent taurine dioxygenase